MMATFELKPEYHTPKEGTNAGKSKAWVEVVQTVNRLIVIVNSEWGDDYEEVVLSAQEALRLAAALQELASDLHVNVK